MEGDALRIESVLVVPVLLPQVDAEWGCGIASGAAHLVADEGADLLDVVGDSLEESRALSMGQVEPVDGARLRVDRPGKGLEELFEDCHRGKPTSGLRSVATADCGGRHSCVIE